MQMVDPPDTLTQSIFHTRGPKDRIFDRPLSLFQYRNTLLRRRFGR